MNIKVAKKKIKIKHNKCGHIWKVRPNDFLRGSRCPICAKLGSSKKEEKIYNWLSENNIKFKHQYSIKGCKFKKKIKI